jgi:serine/threonine-protein kinase
MYSIRMFIVGDDLLNDIGNAKRSFAQVVAMITEVAVALDYAHSREVVHGYVHPRHLLAGPDQSTWLIGFGEYPPADTSAIGNPLHFAPEQLEGNRRATPQTDVYALCETAIWLLSGRHPFDGLHGSDLLRAKRTGEMSRPPRDLLPSAWPKLVAVLQRGLAVEPGARYTTAFEFANALASSAEGDKSSRRRWFWS